MWYIWVNGKLAFRSLYLNEFPQMFTAAKESEFKDEAAAVALVLDIEALNHNRKPRYSVKRRKAILDSLADDAAFRKCSKV